ncbi:hypothetical protein [Myxococcus sp. AS-1-15]|uniref:hypothetical protein n=1 Tax=Myxococcus sp. AS-1-15 TaxID=2874600 RepID=UPI001CBDE2EC|nr:hypothetical protein [Myxococcus sp. AS-1-15]MBZ4402013.1 hypothetical protein [Myxococcus sp. AS-1-15]
MKLFRLSLLSLSLLSVTTGCATLQERRCSALQDELEDANVACTACLGRLSAVGDASLCQYVCAHSTTVAPATVMACTPEAPAVSAPAAASSASSSEASADSSQP